MAKHPAAFINAIAEDGTKDEAVRYLQSTWDDLCDLRAENDALQKALLRVGRHEDDRMALRKDAERYDWLRSQVAVGVRPLAAVVFWMREQWVDVATPNSLDSSIDDALAAKGET